MPSGRDRAWWQKKVYLKCSFFRNSHTTKKGICSTPSFPFLFLFFHSCTKTKNSFFFCSMQMCQSHFLLLLFFFYEEDVHACEKEEKGKKDREKMWQSARRPPKQRSSFLLCSTKTQPSVSHTIHACGALLYWKGDGRLFFFDRFVCLRLHVPASRIVVSSVSVYACLSTTTVEPI